MHVAKARCELGEACVLTTRDMERPLPNFLTKQLGRTVFVDCAGVEERPAPEDSPLPLTPTHPLPVSKKILELMGALLHRKAEFPIVNLRIGGAWGR